MSTELLENILNLFYFALLYLSEISYHLLSRVKLTKKFKNFGEFTKTTVFKFFYFIVATWLSGTILEQTNAYVNWAPSLLAWEMLDVQILYILKVI